MIASELLGLPIFMAEQLLKEAGEAYEVEEYAVKAIPGAKDLRVLRAVKKENKVRLLVSPFLTDLQAILKDHGKITD